MKRKFNFYCILLLIAVAFSLFTAAQHFVEGFNSGYADATLEFQDRATGKTCKPYILDLRSHNPARRELAMTNTMTGNTDSLRVSLHSEIDSMLLVIGLGLLMVSQLFAVGQKMKEENDLTI